MKTLELNDKEIRMLNFPGEKEHSLENSRKAALAGDFLNLLFASL